MIQERVRGQEWVRKMDELGIGPRMPALYEVVVGAGPRADFLEQDLTKFNEKTWKEFMVSERYASPANAGSTMTLLVAASP